MQKNMLKFEWDKEKDKQNQLKHGVSFKEARKAFNDPRKIINKDLKHSIEEDRYYCFGICNGEVLTVRFTERGSKIRIIGAGYWRDGIEFYNQENGL